MLLRHDDHADGVNVAACLVVFGTTFITPTYPFHLPYNYSLPPVRVFSWEFANFAVK